ncbi:MAG: glycogen/starch synthase [Clostridia bacterium]
MTKNKVLYVTSECAPFSGTSSLSEVSYSLPHALSDEGFDIRVISPLYASVSASYFSKMEYLGKKNVALAWRIQPFSVYKYVDGKVIHYFLQNEFYFGRDNLYGYLDDNERFIYFCKAVVDTMGITGFKPNMIHTNDWQTALVPIYMKLNYSAIPEISAVKQLFAIQHIARQGKCDTDLIEDLLGISRHNQCYLENSGKLNFIKGAIVVSDRFITVSPNYAAELKNSMFAVGLEGIISLNHNKFSGLLHGIDYSAYNPMTDDALFMNYGVDDISGKAVNKEELQRMLSLKKDKNIPMISMITKLVSQKGVDIVKLVINEILNNNIQFILLGQGEIGYESFFDDLERRYPGKMRSIIMRNEDMAHKLFAASDYFLMPSQSEPCGRSQMIASRYGAIPIVRKIGGLADSIYDVSQGGNGYVFSDFTGDELLRTTERALDDYKDKQKYEALVKKVMNTDFSWKRAAVRYTQLYEEMLSE